MNRMVIQLSVSPIPSVLSCRLIEEFAMDPTTTVAHAGPTRVRRELLTHGAKGCHEVTFPTPQPPGGARTLAFHAEGCLDTLWSIRSNCRSHECERGTLGRVRHV